MKIPRFPGRTPRGEPRIVIVDHLRHSQPKRAGIFKRAEVVDYDSPEGVVREYHYKGSKIPEYRLRKTGEKVNIEFSFSMLSDLERYFHDTWGNSDIGDSGI